MSVLELKPKFLYPYSRQFPFDEVAEKIVKALEKRNWRVPGIVVEFDTYGSGEAKYKLVRTVKGDNFKLYFCRIQGRLSEKWNDTAALSEVYIPKQCMEVFSDESGPLYYLYVGKNWIEDKEWFMNSSKVLSKISKEPRRYLRYTSPLHKHRPVQLVHDNDDDREYSPIGNEPKVIDLNQKFKEFISWLEEFTLKYILSFPEEDVKEENNIELIPYEGPWTTVFNICGWKDAERIIKGKENPSELPPEKRHAYFGCGKGLVSIDVRCDGRFPEIARDGFIWCDVNPNITPASKKNDISVCINSMMGTFFSDDNYIIAVKPKYANGVYVADNAMYEETRRQLFEAIAPRERLTNEEIGNAIAARGATIIPITEYKGDYKDPILLINRELDFEEIDWVAYNH